MNRLAARLERLERERVRAGGCLGCALARISDPATTCDGSSCSQGLADILMDMRGETECETC